MAFAFYQKLQEAQESLAALYKHESPVLHRSGEVTPLASDSKEAVIEDVKGLTESTGDAEGLPVQSAAEEQEEEWDTDNAVDVYELLETNSTTEEEQSNAEVRLNESNTEAQDENETRHEARHSFAEVDNLTCLLPLNSWNAYSWRCYLCAHSASNCRSLGVHLQDKHNLAAENMQFVCMDCQKLCPRYNTFLNHVRMRHHASLALRCDACDQPFEQHAQLAEHRQSMCAAASDFPNVIQCNVCGKSYPNLNAVRVHARSQHTAKSQRYQCAHCKKSLKQLNALRAHERTHTGVKAYTCELCGREFGQKSNLDVHLYSHISDKNYECSLCKKSFKTAINLEKHKLVHSDIKNHGCDYCGKKFRTRDAKLSHERTHTGEKPYVCEHCERRFRFRSTLISHVYTHTGERPYTCEECNHHFTNWPNYNKHMKRRHGKSATAKAQDRSTPECNDDETEAIETFAETSDETVEIIVMQQ